MGRPLEYNPKEQVETPSPIEKISKALATLKAGDKVMIEFNTPKCRTLYRSVSVYCNKPTPRDTGMYVLLNTDHDPKIGNIVELKSYSFRPVQDTAPEAEINYFVDWIITGDGYVRDTETWGLITDVLSISKI
jgi:hypothetical protein